MKKKYKINIFISIIFICLFISFILLNYISKIVVPIFMSYVESEMKNMSVNIINKTISSELSNIENMILITKNNSNEIQMIDFESKEVNKLLVKVTDKLLESLKNDINNKKYDISYYGKGIIYEIPLGVITNNVYFENLGTKIPVKLNIIGDVYSNIKTNIKEYGINNALLEVYINISVTERVIIPFKSEKINISVDVPISIKLIQGKIPEYYGGIFSKNSGILSVPTE